MQNSDVMADLASVDGVQRRNIHFLTAFVFFVSFVVNSSGSPEGKTPGMRAAAEKRRSC